MELPKKGDKLYIPSSYFISHGSDDVDGGLATIASIDVNKNLPEGHRNRIFVSFEETGAAHAYNLTILLEDQEKLAKEYAGKIATPSPDIDTPWIEDGDIVDGKEYHGPDIW